MEVLNKITTELSDIEIDRYLKTYNGVFKLNKTLQEFKNQYLNTCLGYSFHTILYDNGLICGAYALIPFEYEADGKKVLLGLGTDMFIKDGYREDISNLLLLLNSVIKNAKSNNIAGCFGFPNDNSNNVSLAFLKEKRIGLLDTYILPYKVGDYKNELKMLNPLSKIICKCILQFSNLSSNKERTNYVFKKCRSVFENTRYKWYYPENYHIYKDKDLFCSWKIDAFEGVKACFLMDVYPMSKYSFDKAVRMMVKAEKDNAGLFLYVGHLLFSPFSMVKIPRKFEPKTFRFDFRILDKEHLSKECVYKLDNWEVNLSSYDLL